MEHNVGVEPTNEVLQTTIRPPDLLCLYLAQCEGLEPPKLLRSTVFRTASSSSQIHCIILVGRVGIEPTESQTPNLQSGPLPSTDYLPIYKTRFKYAAFPLGYSPMCQGRMDSNHRSRICSLNFLCSCCMCLL